ncbi:MAG: hypothetical protein KME40_07395 [Komarekiella atlantica HA4396-MV6]|nr:hypothetical protein [Komarekiella atlantica HA4396-MV6]
MNASRLKSGNHARQSLMGSQHVAEVPSVVVTGVGSADLYPCGEASYKAASPLGRSNWRGNPQTLDSDSVKPAAWLRLERRRSV